MIDKEGLIRGAALAISESHVLYNEDEVDVFERILATELAPLLSQSSRVQELEEALRVVVDHLNSGVQWHPDDDGRVRGTITHAERALAGKKEGL